MADDPWAKFNPQKPDSPAAPPEAESGEDKPGYLKSFGAGILQGTVFDPVMGINQLLEHASNDKIGLPDSVKKALEDYKERYTGSDNLAGEFGEGIGTIASFAIPGSVAIKGASALGRGVGLIGRGASAAGEAVSSGAGALGRLARVIKTPPPAVPGLAGRARAGAGEAAKAFRKGKQLEEPAAKAAASPAAATTERSIAEKMMIGSAGGAAGAAVSPVDENQGDFLKQKEGQILAGAIGGSVLGTPGAASGAASAAVSASISKFGLGPTLVALSTLTPSLGALAAHHNHHGWAAISYINDLFKRALQRPGAAYAGGRAAAPITGPMGGAILETIDDNSK